MILRIFIFFVLSFNVINAINFYPLPKSFTNTIWVSPTYGVFKFKDLDLSSIGGNVQSMHEIFGIGVKWGHPMNGLGFVYKMLKSSVVSPEGGGFKRTALSLDVFKLRWHAELINDGTGWMAIFSSLGQFSGIYYIEALSEANGLTEYRERLCDGILADIGIVFGVELNSEWHLFLEALYQFSMNESVSTAIGNDSNDPMVDMTGAMIQIGSALRL